MVKKLDFNVAEVMPPVEVDPKEKKKNDNTWSKFLKTNKVKKDNQVAVLFLRNNSRAEPYILTPKDGMFEIAARSYHERSDCKYSVRFGKDIVPLAVIREKDLKPIGNKDWDDLSIEAKLAELQYHVIKGIRTAEIVRVEGNDKKMDMKTIVIIGIIAVVALVFLQKYI